MAASNLRAAGALAREDSTVAEYFQILADERYVRIVWKAAPRCSRTRDLGGSGLGLAIVSTIMKLHRGEARVDSDQQGNTRFTLRFPSLARSGSP